MRNGLREIGFDTLQSETQIIPIFIGSEDKAIQFTRLLFEKGVFAPCVRWPAVERRKARIRFSVMATHTREQIDHLLKSCSDIGKELDIV